jgi:thioredoxin 1
MARRKHKDHKASIEQRSAGAPPLPGALPGQPPSAQAPGVIELTEQNFAASVDGHPFAVIGIWAPSSAPSRAFASSFAAAAARNPDALFAKVDADAQRAVVEQFEITTLPALIIFRSNIIVYAKASMLQAQELDEVVNTARALDMQEVRRKVVSVNPVTIGDPNPAATDVHGQPGVQVGSGSTALEPRKDQPRTAAIQPADSLGVVELTDRNFAPYVSGHPLRSSTSGPRRARLQRRSRRPSPPPRPATPSSCS